MRLKARSSHALLWTRYWTFWYQQRREFYSTDGLMSASHELCSMGWVKVSSVQVSKQTNKQLTHIRIFTSVHPFPQVLSQETTDGHPPRTGVSTSPMNALAQNNPFFTWIRNYFVMKSMATSRCVSSPSITHSTEENTVVPTAIHVLSKCRISRFADLTRLLHKQIQICKPITPHVNYTKSYFSCISLQQGSAKK